MKNAWEPLENDKKLGEKKGLSSVGHLKVMRKSLNI